MSKTTSFGFLAEQVKGLHKDLRAFEEKTERKFDQIDNKLDRVDSKVDSLDQKVDGLAKALRGVVGDAVREANRDRDRRR